MKTKSAESILTEVFKANPEDRFDLQISVTLNPSVDRIKEAMETYAEQFKPKWVPVRERLPERHNMYLVCAKMEYGATRRITAYLDRDGTWDSAGREVLAVTHWQELPQLPNENKEE